MNYEEDLMKVFTPRDQYIENLDEDLSEDEIQRRYFTTEYYGMVEGKWKSLVNFNPLTSEQIMYDDGFSFVWEKRRPDFIYLSVDIFEERYPEELI